MKKIAILTITIISIILLSQKKYDYTDDGSLKYITVDFSKESSIERFAVNNSDGTLLFSCKWSSRTDCYNQNS